MVDHLIKLDNAAPSLQFHYEPSTLLRTAPPLCPASVLSSSWGIHLDFSLNIRTTASRVPHKSLNQIHATFMPDTAQAVDRLSPGLILAFNKPPVLMSSDFFSTPHQWFVCTHLSGSHLTRSKSCLFLNAHHTGSLPMQLKVV
jgi:hypothetical protein